MKITILPLAGLPGQNETTASVSGDTLTVNGVPYAFGALQEGDEGTIEGDTPFIGPINREAGEIVCAILWQYDPVTAQPAQPAIAAVLTVASGPVPDPIIRSA